MVGPGRWLIAESRLDFVARGFLADAGVAAPIRTDLSSGKEGSKKAGGDLLSRSVQGANAAAVDRRERTFADQAKQLRPKVGEGGGLDFQRPSAKDSASGYSSIFASRDSIDLHESTICDGHV